MKPVHALIAAVALFCPLASTPLFAGTFEIPTDLSQKEKPATIKVLIGKELKKVLIEAKGRYSIFNPFNALPVGEGIFTKRQWLSTSEKGLVWGELIPGIFQIRLVPADAVSTILVDGIEYRGCVEIYAIHGKLNVVNEIDVERYLKSTMASQSFNDIDEEVMDAIAITERTNTYYLVSRKLSAYWHVDAEQVHYQGYALAFQNQSIERAIDHTRHMVMTYQGMPFPACFVKNSAGKTASYTTIFRKDIEAPPGVETPFAGHERQKHHWTFSISKQDLVKALSAARMTEFNLYQDSKSQKVYGAQLKDSNRTHQFDFAKLQAALGSSLLKSNDFTIEAKGDKSVFKGFGEGNGVGLCLFSASAMADKGEKAPKILAFFFPGTKLEKIRSLDTI